MKSNARMNFLFREKNTTNNRWNNATHLRDIILNLLSDVELIVTTAVVGYGRVIPSKKRLSTLAIACILSVLAINITFAQGSQKQKEKSSASTAIGLSYGWAFGDGGLKSSLFTFHVLFPKRKGRYLELETQYYRYSANENYSNANGDIIGTADVLDWHIESRIKYAIRLLERKRFEMHLIPFGSLFYGQGEWLPRSPNAVPETYKQIGMGLGLEIRPVYYVTDRLGLFTAISYSVFELFYEERQFLDPSLPINRQKSTGFMIDIFGNRLFWTVGVLYSFQ